MTGPAFDKYEARGAYHWGWADPGSPDYAPAAEARYSLIVEHLAGAGRVLDIGCGDGFLLGRAAAGSELAVGVDPEPSGVALARGKLADIPGCSALVASGSELPFPDGSFDAVVLADVVEHLEDPGATLREAGRVLRPDGRIVVTTPRRLPDHWWDRQHHVREYESAELRELLELYFGDVDVIHFISLRWWAVRKRLGKIFMRLWSRFLFNPFRKTGTDPTRYGHLLAVGRRPLVP
jgi:SAM-dependent methyltransferase